MKHVAGLGLCCAADCKAEPLENRILLTTFYVDTNNPLASDGNPGTAITEPLKTINHALLIAENNSGQSNTILIRGGVYHEQPYLWTSNSGASATNPTIISAYVNPVTGVYEPVYIDAADPTTGTWIQNGTSNIWYLNNFTTETSGVWVDWSSTNDGASLQQIGSYNAGYFDNRTIVGSGVSMYPGTYYGDIADSRLYVWLADGSNPNLHTIEYANRGREFYQPGTALNGGGYSYANYVDFIGLNLRHDNVYDTIGQQTGCAIYTQGKEELINCNIQWNAGVGVFLGGNSEMLNCVSSNNGGNGVIGQGEGFLISGGQFDGNYWRQYSDGGNAGIKVISNTPALYGNIINVHAANNDGQGIWFDTCFENSVVSDITGNYVYDNQGAGIDIEASRNDLIANNVIVGNQSDGISLNAAENVSIDNNTLVGNYGVATIELDGGTRSQGTMYPGTVGMLNNSIDNNIIANNFSDYDLDVPTLDAGSAEINNNTSDYNLFYRRGGPLHFTTGGTYIGWGLTPGTLAGWQSASGQDAHSLIADPLFIAGAIGALNYEIGSNSPARNAGATIAAVTTDYLRNVRPQVGGYDIGAFEYLSGGGIGTPGPIITNTDPTVWVDDQLSDNSTMTAPDQSGNTQENRFWVWNSTTVYSGAASLDSTVAAGPHRQYFTGADPRAIGISDILFAYLWIDPANLPNQVMLEWQDSSGSWNHLAYWGDNLIGSGIDGSTNMHYMGSLPVAGQWVRLAMPASQIGLAGVNVSGFSFDVYNGRALIDKIGNVSTSNPAIFPGSFSSTSNGDDFIVGLSADGTLLEMWENVPESSDPTYWGAVSQLTSLTLNTGPYNSTMTVDFSNGSPLPSGELSFNGSGVGGIDILGLPTASNAFQVSTNAINVNGFSINISQPVGITITGGSGNDVLTQLASPAPVAFVGGGGIDVLNVDGGNYTFNGNPESTTNSLTVNVAASASITFAAGPAGAGINTLQLAGLNLSAGAVAVLDSATSSSDRSVMILNSLIFAGTSLAPQGRLDLGNNDLILHDGNPAAIYAELASGYNSGNWNGAAGIVSNAAQLDTTHLTALGFATGFSMPFDGQNAVGTNLLLKYTYYGDANLDGRVDGSDYSRVDNAALFHLTGWSNGDFNYDGVIDGSDYTLIDNAYNMQGVSLASSIAVPASKFAIARVALNHPNAVIVLEQASYLFTDSTMGSVSSDAFDQLEVDLKKKPRINSRGFKDQLDGLLS